MYVQGMEQNKIAAYIHYETSVLVVNLCVIA